MQHWIDESKYNADRHMLDGFHVTADGWQEAHASFVAVAEGSSTLALQLKWHRSEQRKAEDDNRWYDYDVHGLAASIVGRAIQTERELA